MLMSGTINRLSIAYVMQNTGVDLSLDAGAPILVKHTVRGLQKEGHQVNVLALRNRSVVVIDDVSKLEASQVPLGFTGTRLFMFFESGVRYLQGKLGLPYFALFDTYRFYDACYRSLSKYAICHEYAGLFSLGAALACLRLGIPYVITSDADLLLERTVLGNPLRGLHALVARWVGKLTYKAAKTVVCVSEPAKRNLVENWQVDPEKIIVVPNGVDVELFGAAYDSEPIRLELGLGQAPVIGFVGGFQVWHGLDGLLESFVQVLPQVPQAKLLLVGDGPARPMIEQKIAELSLESAVVITGFIPQVRVPEMLSVVDVAVIPYPRLPKELWFSPLKLYEYMAAGKAIVASRAGQIVEVIQDGHNGLLVESGNVNRFARVIVELLKNPAERKRLGQNARQQAVEQHSWQQYVKRLEEVYVTVLEQTGENCHK